MTPKEIIKIMKLFTNQDEELIIAWWEKSFWEVDYESKTGSIKKSISSSNWLGLVDYSERMDWSCINEKFNNYLEE